MPVEPRDLPVQDVVEFVERSFRPVADQKQLKFRTGDRSGVSPRFFTDPQRLQQVLKNLLANAFKFTETGGVVLRVQRARPGTRFMSEGLAHPERVIAFSVADTGIGIAQNKQKLIFEAFSEPDGTTSRKYGTGLRALDLAQDRAPARRQDRVESRLGEGSTATLYLPERYIATGTAPLAAPDPAVLRPIEDDRDDIQPGDRVLLIIEG